MESTRNARRVVVPLLCILRGIRQATQEHEPCWPHSHPLPPASLLPEQTVSQPIGLVTACDFALDLSSNVSNSSLSCDSGHAWRSAKMARERRPTATAESSPTDLMGLPRRSRIRTVRSPGGNLPLRSGHTRVPRRSAPRGKEWVEPSVGRGKEAAGAAPALGSGSRGASLFRAGNS